MSLLDINIDIDQAVVDGALMLADMKWKKEMDNEWIQLFNDKPLYYLDANCNPAKFQNIYSDEKIIRVFTSPSTYTDTIIKPRVTISLGSGIIFFETYEDAKRFSGLYKADYQTRFLENNERTFGLKCEHVTSWPLSDSEVEYTKSLKIDGLYSLDRMDSMINLKGYFQDMLYVDVYNKYSYGRIQKIYDNYADDRNRLIGTLLTNHSTLNKERISKYSPYNSKMIYEVMQVGSTVYICDYNLRIPPHGVSTDMMIHTILHGWRVFRTASDALEHCKRIQLSGNYLIHLEDRKYKSKFYVDYCNKKNAFYRTATVISTRLCLFVFNTKYKNKMLAVINKKKAKILDKIMKKGSTKPNDNNISEGDIINVLNEMPEPIMMTTVA